MYLFRSNLRMLNLGCRVLLLAAIVSTVSSICSAAVISNTISGARFTERLNRTVRFVHAGPVVGDFALLNDRGSLTIQGTLPLDGVDITTLAPSSRIIVGLESVEGEEFGVTFVLGGDPRFEVGDRQAKIVNRAAFGGRTQIVSTASVRIDPIAGLMKLKFTAKSLAATVAPDTELESVGFTAVADRLVGQPSQEVDETMLLTIAVGLGDDQLIGSTLMNVSGRVKTTPRTDPEIGTFNSSIVALVGVPTAVLE